MAQKKEASPNPESAFYRNKNRPASLVKYSFFSFENDDLYNKKNFIILAVVAFAIMICMSLDVGVNGDEKFQVDYSKKLWSYYATLGKDTSALNVPEGNMHLYGGVFDLTAAFLNKVCGLNNEFDPAYHTTRRILCVVFGFIAIVFTSLFGKQIGGWPLAFITLIFMFLSPRFLGDTFVNPKDVPFAAGDIMSLYFISRFIQGLPKPKAADMFGIIFGVLIALNTRSGGLLLIVYLFLFVAIYLVINSFTTSRLGKKAIVHSILYTVVVGILAYMAGIIFWPYALADPMVHPIKSLTEFTNQPITITVLFGGLHVDSSRLPWHYIPQWIIRTIPLGCIIGIFFFIRLLKNRFQDIPVLEISILVFSIVFPIGYAIMNQSSLHDGWRHFLFVYPSIVVIAAMGWFLWFTSFRSKAFRNISFVLLLCLLSENIFSIIVYHPYQYTYFNRYLGGLKKAYGQYETDYWMLSIKAASEWLKKHEKIGLTKNKITIATNCMYPSQVYLTEPSGSVDFIYTNYYDRSYKNWDYALFYSRFIHRDQLLNKSWPPKGTIHIVKADGIPLCAVVKRENRDDYLGFESMKRNDIQAAIAHFVSALTYAPQNETVSFALAEAYKSICQYDQAVLAIQQSISVYPDNAAATKLLEEINYERIQYVK